jgi:NADH-quinone oxidoreductase subunit H
VLVVPVFLALAVVPVGRNMAALDTDAGVLFFFAVGAATELSVFMAGWSSRNKYSMLGAMRAIAQMISYEVPLILSAVTVIMAAGSLSTVSIIEAQTGYWGILPRWYVLTPWGLAGFILFMIAAAAESNRSPFDLPEAESEIIAGYYTEYSGFKFALFFLGEYLGLFAVSGIGIALFLGGWHSPLACLEWLPSWFWFFAKLMALIGGFIWVRGTLPRLRMDQLMGLAWKLMLPLALANILAAGVWSYMPAGAGRWIVCSILVVFPYLVLGRAFAGRSHMGKRIYRYAD